MIILRLISLYSAAKKYVDSSAMSFCHFFTGNQEQYQYNVLGGPGTPLVSIS